MFLSHLSYKQRKVFLGLAKQILTVDDNRIDSQEESYLRGICGEMSLGYNDEVAVEFNEYASIFVESDIRRIVLIEAIALGYSNNIYHDNQNKFTDELAVLFGIETTELDKIEEMMNQFRNIQDSFIDFISVKVGN